MATAQKKPAGKKKAPSKKAAPKRKRPKGTRAKAKAAKAVVPKAKPNKRLTVAQQGVRDSLMLTRKIQGASYSEIAAEFEVNISTAKRSVKAKREAGEPILDRDVVEIIEGMVDELQAAISDFEKMTLAAIEANNVAVAVGAKDRAVKARRELRELLQSVGVLPNDLGTVHHIVDIRAVIVAINDNVEHFVTVVEKIKMPKRTKKRLLTEARRVSGTLDEIAQVPHSVGTIESTNGGGGHDDG